MIRNIFRKNLMVLLFAFLTATIFGFGSCHAEWSLETLDTYFGTVDALEKPRVLIIGAGRGELRCGDTVIAHKYDEEAYGDAKNDYFLVDSREAFAPDYVCDATNAEGMKRLRENSWDICILELLPESIMVRGAVKNAFKLVKPGGRVYFDAADHFSIPDLYFKSDNALRKMLHFKRSLLKHLDTHGLSSVKTFPRELAKRPSRVMSFFKHCYGIDMRFDMCDIRLIPHGSEAVWPAKPIAVDEDMAFDIWEIYKF